MNVAPSVEKPKASQFHVPTSFYAPEVHPQGDKFLTPYQKGNSAKKNQRKSDPDFIVDRDVFFPSGAQLGISNEKLRQKIKMMKEKFESDITGIQNELALSKQHN